MLDEWRMRVLVPSFKGKGDARNCNAYRGVKLLEHAMESVERVLESRVQKVIEKPFVKSSKKDDEVGNEKERFTSIDCKSSDEPLPWDQDKDSCGIRVGVCQGSVLSQLLFANVMDVALRMHEKV